MGSSWSKTEIQAELKRRADAELQRDAARRADALREAAERANAVCLHCGNPYLSASGDSEEFPLCDVCSDSD